MVQRIWHVQHWPQKIILPHLPGCRYASKAATARATCATANHAQRGKNQPGTYHTCSWPPVDADHAVEENGSDRGNRRILPSRIVGINGKQLSFASRNQTLTYSRRNSCYTMPSQVQQGSSTMFRSPWKTWWATCRSETRHVARQAFTSAGSTERGDTGACGRA